MPRFITPEPPPRRTRGTITDDIREQVRDLHARGVTPYRIAKDLGLARRTVVLILHPERRWQAPPGYWKPYNDRRRAKTAPEEAIP